MKRINQLALVCIVVGAAGGTALAQSGGTGSSLRSRIKARQDAALQAAQQKASAKAAAAAAPTSVPATKNTINIPTATPTAPATTPTATPTTTPTTTPTAATTATAAASASAAASNSAKPGGSAAPATSGSAVPVVLPPKDRTETAAIALDLEALKKSRPERRHAEVADLQARFGNALLADPRSAAELKLHAQRIAYLQRIRALAVKANDAKLVKDVDTSITKEELRSANAMNSLRSGALPTTAAAAAAPAGGAK
jgi:hypothetical protein